MRHRLLMIIGSGALVAAAASPAFADAGAPGATFPEQPGTHVQTACTAVTTSPGIGFEGVAGEHLSPTAGAILNGLLVDVCFGA